MRIHIKYVITWSLLKTVFKKGFYAFKGTWKHVTPLLLQGYSFYLIATSYLLFPSEAMVCCGQQHVQLQKLIGLRN